MEEAVSDAGIPASRSQVMPPCHWLSSVPVPIPGLVHRQRGWQLCPPTSKILERGWREGRCPARPAAAPPAAPGPQPKCQLGGDVLLEMSGPCSEAQQDTIHPSWPWEAPAGPRHREHGLLPAHWQDGISHGGRQWRLAGGSHLALMRYCARLMFAGVPVMVIWRSDDPSVALAILICAPDICRISLILVP